MAASAPEPKRKRGRPRGSASRGLAELFRDFLIVEGYEAARCERGKTHAGAIDAACMHVMRAMPGMRCSPSQAKKVLAELHSPHRKAVLRVAKHKTDRGVIDAAFLHIVREMARIAPAELHSPHGGEQVLRTIRVDHRPAYEDRRATASTITFGAKAKRA